jgi:hypothetical protein
VVPDEPEVIRLEAQGLIVPRLGLAQSAHVLENHAQIIARLGE